MAAKLREPEAPTLGTGMRGDRRRGAGREWLRPFLQGLSILLAFVGAGLVLLVAGGLARGQGTAETFVQPTVAEPSLSEKRAGFDEEALRERLEEIAEEHEGVYGAAVLEPISGKRVSLRGDEEFVAASIGKLPAFVALYRAAARGELDLEEEISVLPQDIQDYGAGSLHAFPGYSLSLRECAYYLVNYSDNTAWAMLDRRLGEDKIRAELEDMGIKNSRYYGHLSGYYTSPNDVLLLLEKISDPRFTSEQLSTEMLDAMTDTVFEDRIPEKLPPSIRVAHKIGSYNDNFGDAGVVFYGDDRDVEKRYYLVVLAGSTREEEARDAIQNMSLTTYETLTGAKVDPGWSRHREAAPIKSDVGNPPVYPPNSPAPPPNSPASLPSPPENPKTPAQSTEPSKLPLDEKSAPANQYNGSAENAQKPGESAKPTKLPSDKNQSSGNWYGGVPDPSSKPKASLDQYAWEYADPKAFAPTFGEQTTYWKEEYTEY